MENKIFNITYENWVDGNPLPNMQKLYEKNINHFIDSIGIVQHWLNESKRVDKFKINVCNLDDVYKRPNEKFQFMFGHYALRIEEMFEICSPFSENVIKCLKECPNLNFIFHTEHESDNEEGFKILDTYIKEQGINGKQIYVVNNNANLSYYKTKYNSDINVHSIEFIPSSSTIVLQHLGGCEFIPDKEGKFFMTFNRSAKQHRILLLALLKKNNLLNDCNWSYVPEYKSPLTINDFYHLIKEENIKFIKDSVDYIVNLDIKRSDYEEDMGWFNPNSQMNLNGLPPWMRVPELLKNYENSYFNLTTESQYTSKGNIIHITEKSFKPFYHFQFPLILASFGHLKKMRERYDLDFFDDIINHDYDNVSDDKERIVSFFIEVLRIHKNKKSFIEFYKNNKERFLENKRKVDLITEQESDYDFFENLIN